MIDKTVKSFSEFKLTKSWHYLVYIYFVLPLLLFIIAVLTRGIEAGTIFGALFHNYGLFVASPMIHFSALTGIVGVGIIIWAVLNAIRHKDTKDLIISIALAAINTLYYWFGINYLLIQFISI